MPPSRTEIDTDRMPTTAGAYVLVIDLAGPLVIDTAMTGPVRLLPGRYAYCGSARGPGGIRARVRRHLRTGKKVHWHIDRLTAAGWIAAVHTHLGTTECALMDRLCRRPGVTVPVPGFGSSDCRACLAHLVALPSDLDPAAYFH